MSTGAPKTMVCQAADYRKEFPAPVRAQGGGRPSKYCSAACRSGDWARNNGDKVAQAADRYDANLTTEEQMIGTHIIVTIAGPGGVISWPAELIASILRQHGFRVYVETNHTHENSAPWPSRGDGTPIQLQEKHMPWGG